MSMRIIAGLGKGRKLHSPPSITRPTSDRAREGLFSSLVSTFSSLDGLNFLDLFAGSGAVGVEALSRGVALVDAVESNPTSAKVCEKNFALIANLDGVGRFKLQAPMKLFILIHLMRLKIVRWKRFLKRFSLSAYSVSLEWWRLNEMQRQRHSPGQLVYQKQKFAPMAQVLFTMAC